MFTMNIGLNRPDGGKNTPDAVMMACHMAFPRPSSVHPPVATHGPFNSDTEPTVVVEVHEVYDVDTRDKGGRIYRLAEILGQEAIAVYWNRANKGYLVGPKSEEWGEFNPSLFIMPNGERLVPTVA